MFSFFRKQTRNIPAKIDPRDQELVIPSDLRWFATLTAEDILALIQTDDVHRLALYKAGQDQGMSDENAAHMVAKHYASYYLTIERRDIHPRFQGCDAPLPFCVKDRWNTISLSYVNREDVMRELIEATTTMNALARSLLQSHK